MERLFHISKAIKDIYLYSLILKIYISTLRSSFNDNSEPNYDEKYTSRKLHGGHFEIRQWKLFPKEAAHAPDGFEITRLNLNLNNQKHLQNHKKRVWWISTRNGPTTRIMKMIK